MSQNNYYGLIKNEYLIDPTKMWQIADIDDSILNPLFRNRLELLFDINKVPDIFKETYNSVGFENGRKYVAKQIRILEKRNGRPTDSRMEFLINVGGKDHWVLSYPFFKED